MSKKPRQTSSTGSSGATPPTTPPPVVDVLLSRCPACGSTARSGYHRVITSDVGGLAPDGQPYDRLVRRYCRCLDCDQVRIDRAYETGPATDSESAS